MVLGLLFFFNEIPNLKKINFEVEIFNYNKNTIDNYEFYLNQNFIKNFKVTKKNSNYIIELPINYDYQKKVNHLEFINKNRITKADISIYPDPRLLGFRIKKFYFSK
jgi:ribosomal protein S8